MDVLFMVRPRHVTDDVEVFEVELKSLHLQYTNVLQQQVTVKNFCVGRNLLAKLEGTMAAEVPTSLTSQENEDDHDDDCKRKISPTPSLSLGDYWMEDQEIENQLNYYIP